MHPKVTSGSAELIFRRTAEPSNTLDKEPEAAALLPHFDFAREITRGRNWTVHQAAMGMPSAAPRPLSRRPSRQVPLGVEV